FPTDSNMSDPKKTANSNIQTPKLGHRRPDEPRRILPPAVVAIPKDPAEIFEQGPHSIRAAAPPGSGEGARIGKHARADRLCRSSNRRASGPDGQSGLCPTFHR